MKKYLLILSALALIGAGCATSTSVQTNSQVESDSENEATATAETSEGVELIVEPIEGTETEDGSEEDVVEVILGEEADVNVELKSSNFTFEPKIINAAVGQKIEITFEENSGFHTFVIDELDLKFAIKEGEKLKFSAPNTPGTYAFYCDVGSHRANGMEGTLVVK
ncbi:cupredoxin domain-containing protein [Candidatus Uhrbacteria bacterium]|nr:cupredoxin domain-containing protein [Candidatus Uhrbacteria bacterium]